jgi:hypothetical protein
MSPKIELPSAPTWRPTFGRRVTAEDVAGLAPSEAPDGDDAAAPADEAASEERASRRKPAGVAGLLLLVLVFVAVLLVRKRLAGD